MLPTERRDMTGQHGSDVGTTLSEIREGSLQRSCVPQDDRRYGGILYGNPKTRRLGTVRPSFALEFFEPGSMIRSRQINPCPRPGSFHDLREDSHGTGLAPRSWLPRVQGSYPGSHGSRRGHQNIGLYPQDSAVVPGRCQPPVGRWCTRVGRACCTSSARTPGARG